MEKLRVLLLFSVASLCLLPLARAQDGPARSLDSLLLRDDLQALVDAQVKRNAAPLRTALSHDEPSRRSRAAFALGSVQDSTAADSLLELLEDPVAHVRADASFALAQLGRPAHAPHLLEQLEAETDRSMQRELLYAIGKLGDTEALNALVALHLPAELEAERALAVGRFGIRGLSSNDGISYLLQQLAHERSEVRTNAAYFFGRLADPTPWEPDAEVIRERLDALAPDDPAAMHLLKGLARLQDAADVPHFASWLQQATDWRTRVEAARGLGPHAVHRDLLVDALDDPSPHLARAAAEALASSSPWPEALTAQLREWARTQRHRWPTTSALLPGFALSDAQDVLTVYLQHWQDEPPAYAAGMQALGTTSPEYALDRLLAGLRHPSPLVAAASANSLGAHLDDDAMQERADMLFQRLREALVRGETGVIYAVAPLLTDPLFAADEAAEALAEAYRALPPEDTGARMALLEALADTDTETAEALHSNALEAAHPLEQQVAARGLEALTDSSVSVSLETAPAERTVDWDYLAERGPRPHLQLETEQGLITVQLFVEQAPLTAQTIMQLAEEGAYDGIPFHRVIPNFVAQGGDIEGGLGFGGPGYKIRSEFTRIRYTRGTVGMASVGKDSEGSQFFITHSMQPHLDGAYTAFGRVVDGMEAADQIGPFDLLLRATVEPDDAL